MLTLLPVWNSTIVGLFGRDMASSKVGGGTARNFGVTSHDLLGDTEK